MKKLTFTERFFMGGAVAAHQVEGGWNKGVRGAKHLRRAHRRRTRRSARNHAGSD